jgi:HEAT repeat protein
MRREGLDALLELTRDSDPRTRRRAVRELCPCAVRSDVPEIWDRVIEMQTDPDSRVRSHVLHSLCDGSPRSRLTEVVAAVESLQGDPDPRLRRRARGILAAFRRTGKINQL